VAGVVIEVEKNAYRHGEVRPIASLGLARSVRLQSGETPSDRRFKMTVATQSTLEERLVGSVRESQKAILEMVDAWARFVDGLMPRSFILGDDRGHSAPEQLIDRSFDLTAEILNAQREFALALVGTARAQAGIPTASNGSSQARVVPGLGLHALTVDELDRLAVTNRVDDYPTGGTKREKIAALEAAQVAAATAR
jgi:hypothetical protein